MFTSSAAARGAPAVLPDLTYDYGELEPAISGEIMKIHHTKHHQVCVKIDGDAEQSAPRGIVLHVGLLRSFVRWR